MKDKPYWTEENKAAIFGKVEGSTGRKIKERLNRRVDGFGFGFL